MPEVLRILSATMQHWHHSAYASLLADSKIRNLPSAHRASRNASIEVGEPFLDSRAVVHPTESNLGQIENLCRTEAKAQEMEEEEIVQLIQSDQIFCFLLDIAVLISRNQFRTDRRINNIQQGVS